MKMGDLKWGGTKTLHQIVTNGDALYNQHNEQSALCDVTVKVGSWSRRYHWCVLISCPFFDAAYRSGMKETTKDQISIGVGNSDVVDSVLLYLYGRPLVLTDDNLESILEISDFLELQKVRNECIEIIQNFDMNLKRLFPLYSLYDKYNIPMDKIDNFCSKNFLEILAAHETMNASKAFLVRQLKDDSKRCCTKQLFDLIVRWVKAKYSEREMYFTELFTYLKIGMVDEDFIYNVILQQGLVQQNESCRKRIAMCMASDDETIATPVLLGVQNRGNVPHLVGYSIEEGMCAVLHRLPGGGWKISGRHQSRVYLFSTASLSVMFVKEVYVYDVCDGTKELIQLSSRFKDVVIHNGEIYGIQQAHDPDDLGFFQNSSQQPVTCIYRRARNGHFNRILEVDGIYIACCTTNSGMMCLLMKNAQVNIFDVTTGHHKEISLSDSSNQLTRIMPNGDSACSVLPDRISSEKFIKHRLLDIHTKDGGIEVDVGSIPISAEVFGEVSILPYQNGWLIFTAKVMVKKEENGRWMQHRLPVGVDHRLFMEATIVEMPPKKLLCTVSCPHYYTDCNSPQSSQSCRNRVAKRPLLLRR